MAGKTLSREALALFVALMLALPPTEVRADSSVAPQSARMAQVQVTRTANHDWLAKRKPIAGLTLASAERTRLQVGKGSWICSPAGFGRKSSCYAN